ncbi:MAG: InlB B-repeat-containing protein [Clostridia bacterium]|nr:InlB B-repeat-containing protein [Clostridia bacterium]
MKRRFLWILLGLLLLAVCFTACDSGDDPDVGSQQGGDVTVTYYITVGGEANQFIAYDGVLELYDIPARMGYEFLGLYDAPEGGSQIVTPMGTGNVQVTKPLTLYAHWRALSYTITFLPGEGSLPEGQSTMTVLYGETLSIFPIPEREGYDFVGWDDGYGALCSTGGTVNEDKRVFDESSYYFVNTGVTLRAQWKEKKLAVVFDYNDGTYKTDAMEVAYGLPLDPSTFPQVDDGTKFITGWSLSRSSQINFEGKVTEDLTLYAIWQEYKTLSIYTEIGTEPEQIRIFRNEIFECPTPTKDGYWFDGWYSSTLFSGLPLTNVTFGAGVSEIYAKWTPVEYKIQFVTNNGTSLPDGSYTIETSVTLPTLQKDYCKFLGWCMNEDLSDIPMLTLPTGLTGDMTLYASFRGENRAMILDPDGGFVSNSFITVEYGKSYVLPVPMRDGYAFVGWYSADGVQYTDANGNALFECDLTVPDISLIAKYDKKYYVLYDSNLTGAGSITVNEYYLAGETVTVELKVNPGYRYISMSYNGTPLVTGLKYTFVMPEENVTITGTFEALVYRVGLNPNGGFSKDNMATLTFGQSYSLPVAWKTGMLFVGWRTPDGELLTDENGNSLKAWHLTESMSLEASFVENPDGDAFILVYDVETFLSMKENPSKTYTLVSNIDLLGVTWTPFEFSGNLNGNGFTIKNLTVTTSADYGGMFTTLTGTVRDLNFENLTVTNTQTGLNHTGGVCGYLNSGTLNNVHIKSGSITAKNADLGGLVGNMSKNGANIVKNCSNSAQVLNESTSGQRATGGIVGYYQNNAGLVTDCVNHGAVSGSNCVGGILGYMEFTGVLPTQNLINYGEINGTTYVGGLIGRINTGLDSSIQWNSVNHGKVTGTTYVGGLIGELYASTGGNRTLVLSDFTNHGETVGTECVGGVIGRIHISSGGYVKLDAAKLINDGAVTGRNYVGGLLGYGYTDTDESKIVNSQSSGVITAEYYLGGIAGRLENIQLDSCSNKGTTITCTGSLTQNSTYYTYAGGYVGYGECVTNCINEAAITILQKGSYVGGIAGYTVGAINGCTNTGAITAPECDYVGGIVGFNLVDDSGTSSQLTNSGAIVGQKYTGGIFGRCQFSHWDNRTGTISNYINSGTVTGTVYVGGLFGEFYSAADGGDAFTVQLSALKNTADVTGTSYVGGLMGRGIADTNASKLTESSSAGVITAEYYVGGLAGMLDTLTMDNCSNKGSTVNATKYLLDGTNYYTYAGGYVGYGYIIINCKNEADLTCAEQGSYVGGIAGYTSSYVTKCSNTGAISAPKCNYVGGIVGYMSISDTAASESLENSGAVTGKNYVGGIVGYCRCYHWDPRTATFNKYVNSGAVNGEECVGGIFGELYTYADGSDVYTVTMSAFQNMGDVTGIKYVGGLLGKGYSDHWSTMTGSSVSGTITGETYLGGLLGYFEHLNVSGCSNAGTTLTVTGKSEYIGGFAGYLHGSISSCTNVIDVVAPESNYVGGIAGYLYINETTTSELLSNTGTVKGKNYTGGIAGRYQLYHWDNRTGTLSKYTNSGAVTGAEYVGGIIGEIYSAADSGDVYTFFLSEFTNTGNVTGSHYVGGLLGKGRSDTGNSKLSSSTSSGVITAEYYVGGLAGYMESVQIETCSNTGSTVNATKYLVDGTNYYTYVGGYVGRGYIINNCKNEANILCTLQGSYVGGIAGYTDHYITNCSNSGTVTALKCDYVGGLAGYVYLPATAVCESLTNTGAVKGKNYVGGMIGYLKAYYSNGGTATFSNLTNSGAITGTDYVGGMIGELYADAYSSSSFTVLIAEFKNTANVTGTNYVGGLIGKGYTDTWNSRFTGCTNEGTVTGTSYLGGLAGKLQYFGVENCTNENTVLAVTGKGDYIGGLIGYAHCMMNSCSNSIDVIAINSNYVGGVAGYIYVNETFTSSLLENVGTVTGKDYVGGIAGRIEGNHWDNRTGTLLQYTNSGDITGAMCVGGLVGEVYGNADSGDVFTMLISEMESTGKVKGTYNVGGLFGECDTDTLNSKISLSTAICTVTGEYYVGGIVGWSDMKLEQCTNAGCTVEATKYVLKDSVNCTYLGGMAGYCGSTISDCVNEATLIVTGKGNYVGGVVGYATGALNSCSNVVNISAPVNSYVGGVAGYIRISEGFTSAFLENSGNVTGKNYVGGIAGHYEGYHWDNRTGTISQHKNSGAILGEEYVGGIAGNLYSVADGGDTYTLLITEIENTGNVTGKCYVGGLFGKGSSDNGNSMISAGSVVCEVTGEYYVGGLAGRLDAIGLEACTNRGTTVNATKHFLDNSVYYTYAGGFAGYGYKVSECTNEATLVIGGKGCYVGGVVGYCVNALTSCSNIMNVIAPESNYVGGIAGYAYRDGDLTMSDLSNSATVTGKNYVGGVFGYQHLYNYYSKSASLGNFVNSGNVTGAEFVGGIVGELYAVGDGGDTYKVIMTEYVNTGNITGTHYVGGLIGKGATDHGDSKIMDSSSAGVITGTYYVGGLAGYLNTVQMEACSNAGTTLKGLGHFVDGSENRTYAGGYVGYGYSVKDCKNETDIIFTDVGGCIGGIAGYATWIVDSCTNTANIVAPSSDYVGGIVGYLYNNGSVTSSALENTGLISGNNYVGGLIGKYQLYNYYTKTATLSNYVNRGAVNGAEHVGGIAGNLNAYGDGGDTYKVTMTEIFNTGNINGKNLVGGLIGAVETDHSGSALSDYASGGTVTAISGTGGELFAQVKNLVVN